MKACLIFILLLPSLANAQDFMIRGARVHTVSAAGTLDRGDVWVRNGRIEAVGKGLPSSAGATVIEANGRPLTPGLFAGLSGIGLEEVSAEASTVDESLSLGAPAWEAQWRPEFDVTLAYNPHSILIPIARVEGLTWTVLAPTARAGGSVLAGQGAGVVLNGRFDAVMHPSRSLFVYLGGGQSALAGGSRAGQLMLLDQAVRETRQPLTVTGGHGLLLSAGREVLGQYLQGGRVVFQVDRAADIHQVLAFARRVKIRPIIAGGAEAWRLAAELAEAGVPVLLDALENLPADFDRLGARADNAARLHRAGVVIAFSQVGNPSHQARKVRQLAGNAVARGLPWEAGLQALTGNPADIFGVGGERGRITAGQVADLVLWSDDPLEVSSVADGVWIGGEEFPLRSRQTELRDRYWRRLQEAARTR